MELSMSFSSNAFSTRMTLLRWLHTFGYTHKFLRGKAQS